MSETKLKPCPFCGGEVVISDEKIDATREVYNFHCHNCDMVTFYDFPNDRAEAIEHWNTRKPMDNIVAELKEEKYTREEKFQYDTRMQEMMCSYNQGLNKAIDIVKMEV